MAEVQAPRKRGRPKKMPEKKKKPLKDIKRFFSPFPGGGAKRGPTTLPSGPDSVQCKLTAELAE